MADIVKKPSDKVIITCAVTGSIHTPTMSPHLPITPQEIAENALGAAEAGAAIVDLHARDPNDGRPTPDPEVFLRFLPVIKQASDVVVNITTGGGHGMSLDERLAAARRAQPEMCSLNMGSMNFGLYPMLQRYQTWKYDWEPAALERSRDFIFRNTYKDIEYILKEIGEAYGLEHDEAELVSKAARDIHDNGLSRAVENFWAESPKYHDKDYHQRKKQGR